MVEAKYYTATLSLIIGNYVKKELSDKDWEVVAIDFVKDKVVFKCFIDEDDKTSSV